MSTSNELARRFRSREVAAGEVLAQFHEKLAKDAAYALSWSLDAFRAAGRQAVFRELAEAFERDCSVEDARATLLGRVRSAALYPPQSSSPVSNLMDQYRGAAAAEALELLDY